MLVVVFREKSLFIPSLQQNWMIFFSRFATNWHVTLGTTVKYEPFCYRVRKSQIKVAIESRRNRLPVNWRCGVVHQEVLSCQKLYRSISTYRFNETFQPHLSTIVGSKVNSRFFRVNILTSSIVASTAVSLPRTKIMIGCNRLLIIFCELD